MGDWGPLEIALGSTLTAFVALVGMSWWRGRGEEREARAQASRDVARRQAARRGSAAADGAPAGTASTPEAAAPERAEAPARAEQPEVDPAPVPPAPSLPAPRPVRSRRTARAPDAAALVQLHGVERTYEDADGRTVVAARNANLSVHEGEMVALIGPSGLGKSTLLNILGGIDFPTRGTLVHRGAKLPQEECAEVRRYRAEEVCFVFQDLNLVTHLTAVENAALPLLCRGSAREEALAEASKRLAELGLQGLEQRRAHQLSGGQRQRVAIARAFTSRAPLLLADEPTGSLDPETAGAVIEAFARRAREEGRTVVLVTHNPDLARTWCDRIVEVTPHGLVEHDLDAPPSGAGEPPLAAAREVVS